MDSNKRKAFDRASASASPDPEERANKRRKLPNIDPNEETAESTTHYGLIFLEQLRNARDRRGRLIATHFIELPDRREYPDYYEAIVMPLAIETIKDKLNRRLYPNLTTVESDIKRMVSNAKAYNEKGSDIWTDAEKIRKQSVEFMRANNPAYRDPNYTPFPTPLPGDIPSRHSSVGRTSAANGSAPTKLPSTPQANSAPWADAHGSPQPGATPGVPDPFDHDPGFAGRSFQEAQEMLVSKVMNLQDEVGNLVAEPFMTLPPKKLKDYYALIKHPVSLRSIWKKVRGVHGRNGTSGVSDFGGWDALEEEMSLLWRNAREYNEDESDIVRLAGVIEAYFYKIFAEAKEAVSEPAQVNGDSSGTQRLKLKMSNNRSSMDAPAQKIMLRMSNAASKANSSSPDTALNGGVAIDKEALQRQQQHVQAGINGRSEDNALPNALGLSNASYSESQSVTASTSGPQYPHAISNSATSPPRGGVAFKRETSSHKSPSLGAVGPSRSTPGSFGSDQHLRALDDAALMPPPPRGITPRRVNGSSPHPPHAGTQVRNPQQPATPFETRLRAPGKDASDALITNLGISTHPGLTLSHHFHLNVPASATATQQSVTMSLPSSHYYLNIVPTLSDGLSNRPHKVFVTTGTQRVEAMPHSDPRVPVYEVRLMSGVNRIDVEIIAGSSSSATSSPQAGNPKTNAAPPEFDYEKFTIFAHLMKF